MTQYGYLLNKLRLGLKEDIIEAMMFSIATLEPFVCSRIEMAFKNV